MKIHLKAMTYKPKIPAVLAGDCTQTIRPKAKEEMKIGDIILFHGWEGRPYRSQWSWRMSVRITELIDIWIWNEGISRDPFGDTYFTWDSKYCDELALKDHIDPPIGIALGELLNSMYRLKGKDPQPFQIIRWERLEDIIASKKQKPD